MSFLSSFTSIFQAKCFFSFCYAFYAYIFLIGFFFPFRYKKLLCTVDLTKDFYFSYSYHVMRSLQKNLCNNESGQVLYETMFVWNEYLTRGIRNHLQNTLWTVALVYGFFKQVKDGAHWKLSLAIFYSLSCALYMDA